MASQFENRPDKPMGTSAGQNGGNTTQGMAEKGKQAMERAGEALGVDPKEALQNAGEYAQKGGRAAYDTVTEHPLITAALGALGAYLLFRPNSDPYDRTLDRAREYARQARKWAPDVDWSDLEDKGRSYAKRGSDAMDRSPVSSNHLLLLAGVGLVAWLVTTSTTSGRDSSKSYDR